jgi:hypothetical protein
LLSSGRSSSSETGRRFFRRRELRTESLTWPQPSTGASYASGSIPTFDRALSLQKADLTRSKVLDTVFSLKEQAALLVDRAKAAGPTVDRAFPDLKLLRPYRSPYLNWIRSIDSRLARE